MPRGPLISDHHSLGKAISNISFSARRGVKYEDGLHLHDADDRVSIELLVVVLLPVQEFSFEERHLLASPGRSIPALDGVCLQLTDALHVLLTAWAVLVPVWVQFSVLS